MIDNQKTIDFFSNLERVLKKKISNIEDSGIKLSNTDGEARMSSRIKSMKYLTSRILLQKN
jgi:hypothetical protein